MHDKAKAIEAWRRKRERGMARFLLVNGVLMWGLPMFVVMTFLGRQEKRPGLIALSAAIWMIGGLVFGVCMWFMAERNYRKNTASSPWVIGGRGGCGRRPSA